MAVLREIALSTDGDLAFTKGELTLIGGGEAVAQRLQTRLSAIRTEWVFDQTVGTPWFGSIIGAKPRLDIVRQILSRRIRETNGVRRLLSMDLDFDRSTRALSITARVEADTGQAIEIATDLEVA